MSFNPEKWVRGLVAGTAVVMALGACANGGDSDDQGRPVSQACVDIFEAVQIGAEIGVDTENAARGLVPGVIDSMEAPVDFTKFKPSEAYASVGRDGSNSSASLICHFRNEEVDHMQTADEIQMRIDFPPLAVSAEQPMEGDFYFSPINGIANTLVWSLGRQPGDITNIFRGSLLTPNVSSVIDNALCPDITKAPFIVIEKEEVETLSTAPNNPNQYFNDPDQDVTCGLFGEVEN